MFVTFQSTLEAEKTDDIRTRTKSVYGLKKAFEDGKEQLQQKVTMFKTLDMI